MADRYQLERELGRGGMATVYLATDLALQRRVALKLLRPDLAATLATERFLREIAIAARLSHPHILALHDSGQADGRPFYVMPYVEGESLRQRLEREQQLPVEEAVHIVRAVAAALDHAHRSGVVHRDIKPENILLAKDLAGGPPTPLVADFGIARALDLAGGERLTDAGVALGTPAYMSPEQAVGSSRLDGRSDIYALGCVAYEMLTGGPPFTGPTARAVMARQAVDTVPPLRTVRPAVPQSVARAIERALAKVPADRYATAGEFAEALAGDHGPAVQRFRWRPPRRYGLALVGVAALLATVALLLERRPRAGALEAKVLAVVPFRVAGGDSSLRYLREGMLDLLAAKLSGTAGIRVVEPRTLLYAWRRAGGSATSDLERGEVLPLMQELGAGRVVEGEVIGTPARLVLNATVLDSEGVVTARATAEGPADSLGALVDQLATRLLVQVAGEVEHRSLTTTSLPALRAYLDGMVAYRRGDYNTAMGLLDRALEHDSGFAAAAFRRARAGNWSGDFGGRELAWRLRDRLSRSEQLLLYLMIGARYPSQIADAREDIGIAEELVAVAPDDPEAWAELGDRYWHYGALTGVVDAPRIAMRAFERAARLDSTHGPAFEHLFELHYALGDTAAARQEVVRLVGGKHRAAEPVARWFARVCLGDTSIGTRFLVDDSLAAWTGVAVGLSLRFARGLAEAESLLRYRSTRVASGAERTDFHRIWWIFHVIRGKPRQALEHVPDTTDPGTRAVLILDALYAGADSTLAARLVEGIPGATVRPEVGARWQRIVEQYAGAQYRLAAGRLQTARGAVRAWTGVWEPGDTSIALRLASHLALLLDSQLAVVEHRPDALARLVQLDSVLAEGPWYGGWHTTEGTFGGFEPVANLIAARLWYERGEPSRALTAIRRRVDGFSPRASLSSYLRDEGRYAGLAGDRQGAIAAYRHYLIVRDEAEPSVRRQLEEVRAALTALEREGAVE